MGSNPTLSAKIEQCSLERLKRSRKVTILGYTSAGLLFCASRPRWHFPGDNFVTPLLILYRNHILRLLTCGAFALWLSLPALADTAWPESADGGAGAGFSEQGIEELDQAMRQIVADQDVAGMVWLLARNGEVATFDSAGLARVDDGAPMTKDSLFRIYSMTKPVTGVALMMLHEQGLWEFDDPVSEHIPEFADLKLMVSYDEEGNVELTTPSRQPTMRELLNHSAGFGYGLGGQDPVNVAFRESGVLASDDLDMLIDRVAEILLLFEPGEEWFYSVAVDIQGYIVQKLSGMSFGEFLEQRMFQRWA